MSVHGAIVAVWIALNAAILTLLVIQRAHHFKAHRLYWWVVGAQQPFRSVHDLVLAHNHRR